MPVWLAGIFKTLFDWGWKKLLPWLEEQGRKMIINKEENKELDEFEKVKKEATLWATANPGKPLPEELEKRYRELASRRIGGL